MKMTGDGVRFLELYGQQMKGERIDLEPQIGDVLKVQTELKTNTLYSF